MSDEDTWEHSAAMGQDERLVTQWETDLAAREFANPHMTPDIDQDVTQETVPPAALPSLPSTFPAITSSDTDVDAPLGAPKHWSGPLASGITATAPSLTGAPQKALADTSGLALPECAVKTGGGELENDDEGGAHGGGKEKTEDGDDHVGVVAEAHSGGGGAGREAQEEGEDWHTQGSEWCVCLSVSVCLSICLWESGCL